MLLSLHGDIRMKIENAASVKKKKRISVSRFCYFNEPNLTGFAFVNSFCSFFMVNLYPSGDIFLSLTSRNGVRDIVSQKQHPVS